MSDAPLPSSFDSDPDFFNENRWEKFTRKLKEEPLIPIGVGLTCWAFFNASRSIKAGDGVRTNRMFRYRLYAQFFTIMAMLGGSYYYNADRLKRSEFRKLKSMQEKQEKKDKWIRELEAREMEDREWRDKLGKVRDLQREEAENKMVEEKRARDRAAAAKGKAVGGPNDDGRGVIAAIREKSNASRMKEGKMQEAEKEIGTAMAKAQAQAQGPGAVQPPTTKEEKSEKFRPLLGESEEGGLLGIGHIKKFWAKATYIPDAVKEEKKPPSDDASKKKEPSSDNVTKKTEKESSK